MALLSEFSLSVFHGLFKGSLLTCALLDEHEVQKVSVGVGWLRAEERSQSG